MLCSVVDEVSLLVLFRKILFCIVLPVNRKQYFPTVVRRTNIFLLHLPNQYYTVFLPGLHLCVLYVLETNFKSLIKSCDAISLPDALHTYYIIIFLKN